MANKSKLSKSLHLIKKSLFRKQTHIYSFSDLSQVFSRGKQKWNLPKAMTTKKFIENLLHENVLGFLELDLGAEHFQAYYLFDSHPAYIVSKLINNTYISHSSALQAWGLTDVALNCIYINREQSEAKSSPSSSLNQTTIDQAFAKQQRQASMRSTFGQQEIILIRGRFSRRLGVVPFNFNAKEDIFLTNLERTLIDCIVRPAYAPSSLEMVLAFRQAKKLISVALLAEYLYDLDYIYPYHQSIGFYLERAGNYLASDLEYFSSIKIEYNFYLDYGMDLKSYDPKWKIFYPSALD